MYYSSYSLPAYETIMNPEAFARTTIVHGVLMFVFIKASFPVLPQKGGSKNGERQHGKGSVRQTPQCISEIAQQRDANAKPCRPLRLRPRTTPCSDGTSSVLKTLTLCVLLC